MNKKELFDFVINMESQIGDLYSRLGHLKKHLAELIEENNILKIENDHLRNRMNELNQVVHLTDEDKLIKRNDHLLESGVGHNNLVNLYQEGFHICPESFGSPREGDECLFCSPFLEKKARSFHL